MVSVTKSDPSVLVFLLSSSGRKSVEEITEGIYFTLPHSLFLLFFVSVFKVSFYMLLRLRSLTWWGVSTCHVAPSGTQLLSAKRLAHWHLYFEMVKCHYDKKLPTSVIHILHLPRHSIFLEWLVQICNSISWCLKYLPVSLPAGHFNVCKSAGSCR